MTRIARRIALGALALGLALAPLARAGDGDAAVEGLLRLVPADAGATLAVVDLRGHARAILDSPIARSIAELPSVKAWAGSRGGRRYRAGRDQIETALGAKLDAIRDDLLGDAVILALHLPADAPADAARGLLLVKVRDRPLLDRLIRLINAAESTGGMLERVEDLGTGDRAYSARRFRADSARGPDFYRSFDDGTFAWSNSESLLRGVLDRKAGTGIGPALADDPGFRATRAGLPGRVLAFVHVAPDVLARFLSLDLRPSASPAPSRDPGAEAVVRALRVLRGIGLALEWRDGPILHAHEVIDPSKLDPGFAARARAWPRIAAAGGAGAMARRIPASALAAAVISADLGSLYDGFVELIPPADRPKLDAARVVARSLLLGRDPRDEVLSRLGPGLVAYVEDLGPEPAVGAGSRGSSAGFRLGVVGAAAIRGEASPVGPAIDNALAAALAMGTLAAEPTSPPSPPIPFRLETELAGPIRVTSRSGASPFAYGIGPDCVVVGTSAAAVARFGIEAAGDRLSSFRAAYFADAPAFAAIDVTRVAAAARLHRDAIARRLAEGRSAPPEQAARDLDDALALLGLFDGAFLSLSFDPSLTSAHQALGLIARRR